MWCTYYPQLVAELLSTRPPRCDCFDVHALCAQPADAAYTDQLMQHRRRVVGTGREARVFCVEVPITLGERTLPCDVAVKEISMLRNARDGRVSDAFDFSLPSCRAFTEVVFIARTAQLLRHAPYFPLLLDWWRDRRTLGSEFEMGCGSERSELRRRAQNPQRYRSPNIPNHVMYIMTEYCEGSSLRTYLHTHPERLSDASFMRALLFHCVFVTHLLYTQRITHYDLHDENMLVCAAPEQAHGVVVGVKSLGWWAVPLHGIIIKVADWGFAYSADLPPRHGVDRLGSGMAACNKKWYDVMTVAIYILDLQHELEAHLDEAAAQFLKHGVLCGRMFEDRPTLSYDVLPRNLLLHDYFSSLRCDKGWTRSGYVTYEEAPIHRKVFTQQQQQQK